MELFAADRQQMMDSCASGDPSHCLSWTQPLPGSLKAERATHEYLELADASRAVLSSGAFQVLQQSPRSPSVSRSKIPRSRKVSVVGQFNPAWRTNTSGFPQKR